MSQRYLFFFLSQFASSITMTIAVITNNTIMCTNDQFILILLRW